MKKTHQNTCCILTTDFVLHELNVYVLHLISLLRFGFRTVHFSLVVIWFGFQTVSEIQTNRPNQTKIVRLCNKRSVLVHRNA